MSTATTDQAKRPIIGRERVLIDKLTKQLHGLLHQPTTKPNLTAPRSGSFEVLILVDGEPTGHVARVTVELDRLDPGLVEQYRQERGGK